MKPLLTLCFLIFTLCASAQRVQTTDLNDKDIETVISRLFDVKMQKYDFSSYLDGRYKFTIYIDEYNREQNDSLVKKRITALHMGQNRVFIEDAESRENLKGASNFDYERGELTQIESLTLAARIESDSTAKLSLSLMPSQSGGSFPLDIITIEQSYNHRPIYSSRPFKFEREGVVTGEIPLFLYGSYYYDQESDVMRFCGEREIDADIYKSSIVNNLLHFYIIGVIIKGVE